MRGSKPNDGKWKNDSAKNIYSPVNYPAGNNTAFDGYAINSQESNRLNIPLLGKIPLEPKMSLTSDSGIPFVIEYPDSNITNSFNDIILKVTSKL